MADHLPLTLGSLRVFGDWFGRPMDNIHTAVTVRSQGDVLVIEFDEGETLTVDGATAIVFDPKAREHRLTVERAERVRWMWYFYGRPRLLENLYVEEHWVEGSDVKARSTVDWYTPVFNPSLGAPAVEFV
jgi:hypothetical protein